MKIEERFKIKDQILKTIFESENKTLSVSEVSQILKLDFYKIHTLADDLLNENLVINRANLATKDSKWHGDKSLNLSPKGQFFLREEGGFKSRYKTQRLKKSWMIAKTIAAVANALIIIYVSIWAINVADKSNDLQDNIEKKNKFIIDLSNEIQLLKKEISDKKMIQNKEKKTPANKVSNGK